MQTRLINHANPSEYFDLLNKGLVQAQGLPQIIFIDWC